MNAVNKDLLTTNVGKKHAVFDIVLTNKRNNTPFFFIFTDTTIINVYSRCLSVECGATPKFTDYSCKLLLSSICSNLGKNIDCFLISFFQCVICGNNLYQFLK